MTEQVDDLKAEGQALYEFLSGLDDAVWSEPTPFKNWTVNQVVAHLHGTDVASVTALKDPDAFRQRQRERQQARTEGRRAPDGDPTDTPTGRELLARWHDYFFEMCELMEHCDPAARVPWVGPDMSVRMMATARQMETWAHGQDIYDLLQVRRENTDRIRNIAFIGVRTFEFTFANRGEQPPGPPPYVRLTAPSGAIWEWNEPDQASRVEGDAVEFCHVVTQGRNIADVSLEVVGDVARKWMMVAQCFAGPPMDPPAQGERVWRNRLA